MAETITVPAKAKKHRSPTYPGINLQQAIKRTAEFYEKEHRNPASFKAAVSHWDYSEKSSGALVTAAALKSFGLLDEIDSSAGRTFQVSQLGLKIVADKRPESVSRMDAIREAALKPKIHAEIWKQYNGRLPSEAELRFQLENKWSFNLNSIEFFIKELRDTISYAKLTESDKVGEVAEVSDDEHQVKVGDYVQWVSQGAEQFRELKRIIELSDDGTHAFVEGEKTGFPVGELEVGEAPSTPAPPPPQRWVRDSIRRPVAQEGSVMRDDVYSLEDGRQVIISWPSSLPAYEAENIKAWMAIVERKIARSVTQPSDDDTKAAQ
jgi:hypothetical protein